MASVYKLPIAIELLAQVSAGTLSLDRPIALAPSDIRACCTLSRRHPRGGVTVTAGELLELMIAESDNTASDAVLKLVGGPPAVERRMRTLGFDTINVNRYEGDINFEMTGVANPPPQAEWTLDLQYRLISEVTPEALREARARYTTSDPRDTSTPDDMARLLGRLQLGNILPPQQTALLLDLMARAKTGTRRLKALLPPDTIVAHKTGTTDVVINDVGIITLPPDSAIGGHLALAVFVINGWRVSTMQQTIAQSEFRTQDAVDKAGYDAKATLNPVYARYQEEVESQLQGLRNNGQNVPRENILRFILGDRALKGATASGKKAATNGQKRVAAQQVRASSSKGDAAVERGRQATTAEARLKDQFI
jgi:beta-lactamase class A